MIPRTLWNQYDQFIPEERVQLTLAALARRDIEEASRLHDRCPRAKTVDADPKYTELLDAMWHAAVIVVLRWVDVSHRVTRAKIYVEHLTLAHEPLTPAEGRSERRLRAWVRHANANWKARSAAWKGIDAGITKFCTEFGFTRKQFFALMKLPAAIDEARHDLNADVACDLEWQDFIYRELCQIRSGPLGMFLKPVATASEHAGADASKIAKQFPPATPATNGHLPGQSSAGPPRLPRRGHRDRECAHRGGDGPVCGGGEPLGHDPRRE